MIINGEFDLSVGSLVAIAITIIATFNETHNLLIASLMGIAVTTLFGIISGTLVAKTNIPSFIVTLGMMSIIRSLSWITIAGRSIVISDYRKLIQPIFASFPGGENFFP